MLYPPVPKGTLSSFSVKNTSRFSCGKQRIGLRTTRVSPNTRSVTDQVKKCTKREFGTCWRNSARLVCRSAWNGGAVELEEGEGDVALSAVVSDSHIKRLMKQQWPKLLLGGLAAVVCSMSNLSAPLLTGVLFELMVTGQPVSEYTKVYAILAFCYTMEPLLSQVYMRNMIQAGERVLATLRKQIFRGLLRQEIQFFDEHRVSDLTNILAVELDTLRSFVFNNVTRDRGIRSLMEASGVVIILFILSWRLGMIMSGVILTTAISAALYKQFTKSIENDQFQALSDMVSVAEQATSNIRTVRSFGGEFCETFRFDATVDDSYKYGMEFGRAKALLEASNRACIHLSLLALFWVGAALVRREIIPYRVLLTTIGYTFSLVFASQGLINTMTDLRKAGSALGRVRNILAKSSETSEAAEEVGAVQNGRRFRPLAWENAVEGDLELRDVWFSYPLRPDSPVLTGLNLKLERGKVTAVVGQSGAGKSTISSLLARFYEPQRGGIYLNGVGSTVFDKEDWNSAVSMVSQEPILFRGSIFENICYASEEGCSEEAVMNAAKDANAHDFIMDLPQGYNTTVGERGGLLSGGQRQRIAIARALLKNAPILILDEATSSLDLVSEAKVQEALQCLVKGRTVMVIAHRLSTIQTADQIVLVKNGQIRESGTHQELIGKQGDYANLVNSTAVTLS